jgi:hypothetical protein
LLTSCARLVLKERAALPAGEGRGGGEGGGKRGREGGREREREQLAHLSDRADHGKGVDDVAEDVCALHELEDPRVEDRALPAPRSEPRGVGGARAARAAARNGRTACRARARGAPPWTRLPGCA